jgi:light-harvesting protein B-800-850 alpha chain
MNNARMWLVLKPTVGIPVFFIVMVIASLSVHFSILTNTTWFVAFLQGGKPAAVAAAPASPESTVVASR